MNKLRENEIKIVLFACVYIIHRIFTLEYYSACTYKIVEKKSNKAKKKKKLK